MEKMSNMYGSPEEAEQLRYDGLSNAQKVTYDAKRNSARAAAEFLVGTHMDLRWIPCTSNDVDQLFSRAKLYSTSLRKNMSPLHLEQLLFLYSNKSLYTIMDLHRAMVKNDRPELPLPAINADEDELI